MNKELITRDEIVYEVVDIINYNHFKNSDGSINQQVLGKYVHDRDGNRVLQRDDKFLICKPVEEATIL